MGKRVFLFILVVVFLLGQRGVEASRRRGKWGGHRGNKSSSGGHHSWHRIRYCFPDNATKARCFANFPNAGHHPKNWLSWFTPQPTEDTYIINDTWSVDTDNFVVTKIEQDPKQLCKYKDAFVEALQCLGNHMRTKCPWLSERMRGKYDKYGKGMDYVCSRIDEMDPPCLHLHWGSMGKCKGYAYSKMSEDFDHLYSKRRGHKGHGHWRGHGNTNSTDDSSRNRTTSGGGRGRWPSRPRGNSTGGSGRGGWERGDHGSRNSSGNSTYDDMKSRMYCRFKYVMLQCVRNTVMTCHGNTAQIMYDFMRNMSDASCQAKMDDWDEAEVMKQVMDCNGDYCASSASRLLPRPLGPLLMVVVMTVAGLGMATASSYNF